MPSLEEETMSIPRRFYIYAVSAISLNAVAWAVISLLRNLLISRFQPSRTGIAFQIAVLLIGIPVFLAHWLWGQRLSNQEEEERGATLRKIYLYGMQSAFLIPIIDSTFAVLSTLLYLPLGETPRNVYPRLPSGELILYYLLAIFVLGVLWYYHHRVTQEDGSLTAEEGSPAVIRRLYILTFSGAGLAMTIMAMIVLIHWLLLQIGGDADTHFIEGQFPIYEIARLLIGLPLWLIFWTWAQRLFTGADEEEMESVLRKFYLYLTIFISALVTVSSITFIIEGFFRRVLDITSTGPSESDIRFPLSIIIGVGIAWAYHAMVLREDAKHAEELPRQEGIKRLYLYLIAGIGLAAFLTGISGDLSILIRSLEQGAFGMGLKSQLTWFAAITIVGIPVWILPWRQAQTLALLPETEGARERRSVVRKIYLYFFLFIATMTVLSSVVFILFKIISMILGEPGPTLSELGQPLAYSIIAVGVWLYHGYLLRGDQSRLKADQATQYEGANIAILDLIDRDLIQTFVDRLKKEVPGISTSSVNLAVQDKDAQVEGTRKDQVDTLLKASIIVGPWMMAVSGWGQDLVPHEIAQAILHSSARKILIPLQAEGWEWAGMEPGKRDLLMRQTIRAVKQVLEGEEVKPAKPLGIGAILGIIIAAIVILLLLAIPLIYLLTY
jgi:hypothetical protein